MNRDELQRNGESCAPPPGAPKLPASGLRIACLLLGALLARPSAAVVTFFTDEAAWTAAVGGAPIVSSFDTTSANVGLAGETGPPAPNEAMGASLTWQASSTGLCGAFSLHTLQAGADLVFEDGGFPIRTISIGKIDLHEEDSFRVETDGGDYHAVGLYLADSTSASSESFAVYGAGDVLLDTLPGLSIPDSGGGGTQFVGAVASEPIHFTRFSEDPAGDDIAVRDFRFACANLDPDADGLDNVGETAAGTDPLDSDSDHDGLLDGFEVAHGFDPLATGDESEDPDGDGLDNLGEQAAGTGPLDPDSDADGLLDGFEVSNGLDPLDVDGDTDDDGLRDAYELANGFDPLDPDEDTNGRVDGQDDLDADGLGNAAEALAGTDPHDPDSDDDGLLDGQEIGTGSFGAEQVISTAAHLPESIFAADVDGDGDLDVLSASGDDEIAWYENTDGRGSFGPQQLISTSASQPQAVFAADLDGDGDADVLSVSELDGEILWFENTDGAGSFGPQQVILAPGAFAIFPADLDEDGDLDVLSGLIVGDEIAWYENTDGAGSFGPKQVISTLAPGPFAVFAADVDGDGDTDVLSSSSLDPFLSNDKIAWYQNTDGAGSFGPQQVISTLSPLTFSISAADVDGDGDPDVLAASYTNDTITWYENTDGAGSFGPQQLITPLTTQPRSVFAVDVDGDGYTDVLSGSVDEIAWYENTNGEGSFGPQQRIGLPGTSGRVFGADLDGDGDMDVLRASLSGDTIGWYAQINVSDPLDPDPDGDGLIDGAEIAAGTSPFDPDSDDDGLLDAAEVAAGTDPLDADSDDDGLLDGFEVANGFDPLTAGEETEDPDLDGLDNLAEQSTGTDPNDADSDDDGLVDGAEIAAGTDPLGPDSDADGLLDGAEIAAGADPLDADSDDDGLLDGFEVANGFDPLTAGEQTEDPDLDGLDNFAEQSAGTDPGDPDTDGDGLLDGQEPGTGSFGPRQLITTIAAAAQFVSAADLDGDGDVDVLSASFLDDEIAWYENTDGLGGFGPKQVIALGPGAPTSWANEVVAADLDGDGDLDVVSASLDEVAWNENTDGLGSFGPEQTISSVGGASVFAADLDGDGNSDVLWGIASKVAWNENTDGAGAFGADRVITTLAGEVRSVAAADVDGDGDLDVLCASESDDTIAWYENTDGAGTFGPQQLISTLADQAQSVFAADVDGDGDVDVLSASLADDEIAWYENTDGAGSFGPQQVISTLADQAFAVFAADMDGDGDVDVLSASFADDEIAWYENVDGAGSFGPQQVVTTLANGARSVFAVDVDGDGDPDVLSASQHDDTIAWYEQAPGTDPLDSDSDDDGLSDGFEVSHGFDPLTPGDEGLDPDADGLDNLGEQAAGTDPNDPDSDGDGFSDGVEVAAGTDPLDDQDFPAPPAVPSLPPAALILLGGLLWLTGSRPLRRLSPPGRPS